MPIRPFLKWVGSKYTSLDHILPLLACNSSSAVYYEPFLGSGAVALNVPHTRIVLGDHNPDLINCKRRSESVPGGGLSIGSGTTA
jgi:site-specific DNA-adenine methylase